MEAECCVTANTLGTTHRRQLERYCSGLPQKSMVLTCYDPIHSLDTLEPSLDIRDWEDTLNLGWEYDAIADLDYGKESTLVDGPTGEDWITDRIIALHDGVYARRLEDPDQLEMITARLKEGMHGSSTNGLVAQVFQEKDLERACVPRPNSDGMACITQLQFHPVKDRLHLHQTLRSQYVDLKGYGNLVAAATLLARVCDETGYVPGSIIEHVNNATALSEPLATKIYRTMNDYAASHA
ncbi:hypothetical protein NP511_18090 [Natrinema thermotolerans]|uniref:Uncharacterized protein n=1 Tax=Natrinema thermotolerans TaxID=121872 RepID=A0AAF0PA21_9EURY|nr:hypothetical protein [Natrinema thermotolerans]WMT07287.1 hypothetical protein NP511_18090 [Natrinema thermotolerans]